MSPGVKEGATCAREGCDGVIEFTDPENCSCHIAPPCGSCTSTYLHCAVCGWEEPAEMPINDHVVKVDRSSGAYLSSEPRKLDNTKIDWVSKPHSSCSMVKAGVYPPGTSADTVRKLVDGTFGGHFNHFGNGKFEFVAYTD